MAGIGHDGLRHPVEVCTRGNGYALISGLHRMMAFDHLDRKQIPGHVLTVDAFHARKMELEENLVRSELTKLDRAVFVAAFRDLFEAEHGKVKAGRPCGDNCANFAELACERLAMSPRSVEYALKIARCLHPDVMEMLRATRYADNQKALLELCGQPIEKQVEIVMRLTDLKTKYRTMREAIRHLEGSEKLAAVETEFHKWLGVTKLKKRMRKRIIKEWIGRDMRLFEEVVEEMGIVIDPANRQR